MADAERDNDLPPSDHADDGEPLAELAEPMSDEELDQEFARQRIEALRRALAPGSSSPFHRPFGPKGHQSGTVPPYISDPNHPIWEDGNKEVFNAYIRAVEWANKALERFKDDIRIKDPQTLADLVRLGTDADVLDFLFCATPVDYLWSPERNAYLTGSRLERQTPTAAETTLTRRAVLHSALAVELANVQNWKVYEEHPEHRTIIERVVSRIFTAYVGHLGDRFRATRNPIYAWYAIEMFTQKRTELPDWVVEYLAQSAQSVKALSNKKTDGKDGTKPKRARITAEKLAIALGFTEDGESFSERLRDGSTYLEAIETYYETSRRMLRDQRSTPPISLIADDLGLSTTMAQKHFDDVHDIIGESQEKDDFPDEHIVRPKNRRQ